MKTSSGARSSLHRRPSFTSATTSHTRTGHNNGSTLAGSFSSFVPDHDLQAYFLYGPCDTFNSSSSATPTESIPATTGNGSISPVAVTGLSSDVTYCSTACVVDLDANATMGDPVGPVCGGMQTFSWTSPVRTVVRTRRFGTDVGEHRCLYTLCTVAYALRRIHSISPPIAHTPHMRTHLCRTP